MVTVFQEPLPDAGLTTQSRMRPESTAGPRLQVTQQWQWGCSALLIPVARACGVGLSAVQLTSRPSAASARAVVGPMAANCRERRDKRASVPQVTPTLFLVPCEPV